MEMARTRRTRQTARLDESEDDDDAMDTSAGASNDAGGPRSPSSRLARREARRERDRRVAQARAVNFAVGRGFVDDDDYERNLEERTADQQTQEEEAWPGPYSTAYQLYQKRSAASAAREARIRSKKSRPEWTPKGSGSRFKAPFPTLMDLCVNSCVNEIDALIENGMIDMIYPEGMALLSKELCRRRKFNRDVLHTFTSPDTLILELPDCSYLGEDDLLEAFETCRGPRLETVRLSFCGRAMSDQVLGTLVAGSPNIGELLLEGCYRLSDEGITAAISKLEELTSLELSSCVMISGACVRALVDACKDSLGTLRLDAVTLAGRDLEPIAEFTSLESLSLEENGELEDDSLCKIIEGVGATLQSLNVSQCRSITDASLETIALKCPGLKEIFLDETQASDKGLHALHSGRGPLAGDSQLETISLRSCSAVTDEGCIQLAKKCPLRSLNLNGLYSISDATILELRDHCSQTLEELDVSWCRAVTDEALGLLVDAVPSLRKLSLRGCSQITELFINGHSNVDLEVLGHRFVEGITS